MEGPQDLKPIIPPFFKTEQITLITIIILFHTVGIVGLSIPSLRPLFLKILPWHLLLMLAVIMLSHKPFAGNFLIFALVIMITAFLGEWIGVHKTWLFGDYTYGKTLGLKFAGIPLTIVINWFLLVYSTGVLMQWARFKNVFIRVIAGAILLVLLDLLIEPTAAKFDYWHWAGAGVPVKNYPCWFIIGGLMLFLFERFSFKRQSLVAPVFLLIEFLFFAFLYLT
jgi:putative membrane protein